MPAHICLEGKQHRSLKTQQRDVLVEVDVDLGESTEPDGIERASIELSLPSTE